MTSQRTEILLEDMNSKFDIVIDMVVGMRDELRGLATKADLYEVKTDAKIIKLAVADVSKQLKEHIYDQRAHYTV